MRAYHDEEWGIPSHDDRHLYELLTLEGAQAGLSWSTILRKREGYRRAFAGFDAAKVARFGAKDVERLLADPGIVRNRLKVESTLNNAARVLEVQEELGSLDAYLWSFVDGRPIVNDFRALSEIPAETDLSKAISKDLKRKGFRFVGPTAIYAFMQSVGMVDDHTVDCFRRAAMNANAPIRYARSGDVNIAYHVMGDGPFDLVVVHGFFSHLEIDLELPALARFHERLASFARVIRFDKRGTGLSDRGVGLPDFETRMDDVRAVMDAVGSESAAIFGYSEGGPMCVLFAATYPERVRALVLYGTYAKRCDPDDDYPWAPTQEERVAVARELERTWGEDVDLSTMWPNADPVRGSRVPAPRARGFEPGRRPRPHPDEFQGRHPRCSRERPVPDSRAPPDR